MFFLATSAAVGTALAAPAIHGAQKNKKFRTALVGSGWWGMNILNTAIASGDVEVVALCDVDRRQLDGAFAKVQESTGAEPKKYKDYRELLDAADASGDLHAVERPAVEGHDIHHAGHGAGSVDGRPRASDNFDPFNAVHGKMIAEGLPEEIKSNKTVIEAYLGKEDLT